MRTVVLVSLATLARHAAATLKPLLPYDLDTVADCLEWYNNGYGESCEYVLNLFGITPEEFHDWNPSVGLDCAPWNEWQSYCIMTETKYNSTQPISTTATASTTAIATSSTFTLGPSPTAWTDMGCYVEDPDLPILEQYMSPEAGDASLTVPKCKNSCYRRAYGFAGVQGGNQCWCGSYVGGEWAHNQTVCDVPCSGNPDTFCGGDGFVNVFRAEENKEEEPVVTATTTTNSGGESPTGGSEPR
ncbi:hypothetical protein VTI28DRAFT_6602 [Corynascus sepedonium]